MKIYQIEITLQLCISQTVGSSWQDCSGPDMSQSDELTAVNRLAMVVLVAANNGALHGNTSKFVDKNLPISHDCLYEMNVT